jgi:hypothetical protein
MTHRDELERGGHSLRADVVVRARTSARLVDGLAREHAERDRDRQRDRELREGSRDGMREHVEVGRLTSDEATEGHDRVETSRAREHCDRRWQLERAGDLELLDPRAFRERGLDGALCERAGDLVVPASAHDRDAGTRVGILHPRRRLPSGRHLPQSSPRMRRCPVHG